MPLFNQNSNKADLPPANRILIQDDEDNELEEPNIVHITSSSVVKEKEPEKREFTTLDYEPPRSTDKDFPVGVNNTTLPALKLDSPLPQNVLTEKTQSRVLGWDSDMVRVVNHQTGIFTDLPMICAGTKGCKFGEWCPVINRDEFIGKSCPLEIREVFKNFSGYVRDLNITSADFVDLKQVAELCKLHLVMWRTDMSMKMEPEIDEEVGVVDQKTGTVYKRKIINKNRELQEIISNRIRTIHNDMVSTRAAKSRTKAKDGASTDSLAELMSKISGHSTRADK